MVGATEQDGERRLATFKSLVESYANSIAEDLELGQQYKRTRLPRLRSEPEGRRRVRGSSREQEALADFDRIEVGAQQSFARAASSTGSGPLVLEEFYDGTARLSQPYADLIATMLAARSEANGRLLLAYAQGRVIAESLERTGKSLLSTGLPRLAERAFREAAIIHARFQDPRAEDRCQYLKLNAHRRTYPWWHPMRCVSELSRWLVGYGYKPMRLLVWIAIVIAGFAVYLLHLPRNPGVTRGDALFMALQNFVNPMGLTDTKGISPTWETPLELETYTGDILRNVFFVLLIRKWFRL
ncbi:hypothetical protein [Catenulispora rubra]|uniref:hypothetical protein n=1 Tax=Catenulispora rubra TaxID=280293 RepID=UPI001891FCCB|nr:hypothetical protein [Catenulispora rubra]